MDCGWGGEDQDFITRAIKMDFICKHFGKEHFQHIPHPHWERSAYSKFNAIESARLHHEINKASLYKKNYIANQGKTWGSGKVMKNFEEEIII